jgi:hypothetical protein
MGDVVARALPMAGGDFTDAVADKYLQPAGF